MNGITYTANDDGTETARWFGKSIRVEGKVVKEKRLYLGKVIDKEKLIFFKKKEGFYRFNLDSLEMESIPDEEVPISLTVIRSV